MSAFSQLYLLATPWYNHWVQSTATAIAFHSGDEGTCTVTLTTHIYEPTEKEVNHGTKPNCYDYNG